MATIYISPTGNAKNAGTSASSALPLTSIDKAIQLAGPGGTVMIIADKGAYSVTGPLNISHGGSAGSPVTIMGVDSAGHAQDIQINGTRPAVYAASNAVGNETFKLLAGASNLVFENMAFANVGTAFRAAADVSNITVQNMFADNVRTFFQDEASGSGKTATISGLVIQNVEVHGFSKSAIHLQYDTNNVLIQNVLGDSEHEDGDHFAMGVLLEGTVHHVTLDHVTMENSVATSSTYWNGDGFTTEKDVYDVTFQNTLAKGNADGGYDLKSKSTTLVNAVAEDNGRNFRIWGDATLTNCTGLDPHKQGGTGGQYQIEVTSGAHVTVVGGTFADSGSNTVVVQNGGGQISFSNTEIWHAATGKLSAGNPVSFAGAHLDAVTATGAISAHTSLAGLPDLSAIGSTAAPGNGVGAAPGSSGSATGTGGSTGSGSSGSSGTGGSATGSGTGTNTGSGSTTGGSTSGGSTAGGSSGSGGSSGGGSTGGSNGSSSGDGSSGSGTAGKGGHHGGRSKSAAPSKAVQDSGHEGSTGGTIAVAAVAAHVTIDPGVVDAGSRISDRFAKALGAQADHSAFHGQGGLLDHVNSPSEPSYVHSFVDHFVATDPFVHSFGPGHDSLI